LWRRVHFSVYFFFNNTSNTAIYTLSLHDALPIYGVAESVLAHVVARSQHKRPIDFLGGIQRFRDGRPQRRPRPRSRRGDMQGVRDRKSTRLNSSHVSISYAVFCLKKKKSCGSPSL